MPRTNDKPRTRNAVKAERIAMIAEMAAKAFANHRVRTLWWGMPPTGQEWEAKAWRCEQPNTCVYWFDIVSERGRLMITGDIGTLILKRDRDMLAWARGSIESIDYFAEKAINEIKVEEYDPEMVRGYAAEIDHEILEGEHELDDRTTKIWLGGDEPLRRALLDALDDGGDEHKVKTLIYESGLEDGCDFPSFENFTPGFLWQREAIKWFLAQGVA